MASGTVATRSSARATSLIGAFITTITTYLGFRFWHSNKKTTTTKSLEDGTGFTESPILKNFSELKAYHTAGNFSYPSIRTFYHPHKHRDKLPALADLPLLVFVHGLGGSLEQFGPLLGSLVNIGPCFGIELPGNGRSSFEPRAYEAYTTNAFADLWQAAIASVCREHGHRRVVLLGHSMGCSLSAILATRNPPSTTSGENDFEVVGVVALCPKATPPTPAQTKQFRRFLSLPDFVLDGLRFVDKIGGVDSKSVTRFVGPGADVSLRRAQLYFNAQFPTPVWKRAAIGCLPRYEGGSTGQAHGGLPGREVWSRVASPLFLVAGGADTVTKAAEVDEIIAFLQPGRPPTASPQPDDASQLVVTETTSQAAGTVIKAVVLPAPAAHALPYDPAVYRTLAGLIEDFLGERVSPHLDLGWQLQALTTTGKWDVKNLAKWQATIPVSGPIYTGGGGENGLFRALKTLREQDAVHGPRPFVAAWRASIYAVVDISHDPPVYETKAVDRAGIHYYKLPTVSKVPPTVAEVADFVALIDRIRRQRPASDAHRAIAVHCHYGYNRTGFFICAYLVEREGFSVDEAVAEFRRAKPPGIKHQHFIDTLYVRYYTHAHPQPGASAAAAAREHEEDSEG